MTLTANSEAGDGLGLLGRRLGGGCVVAGLGSLDILELLGQGLDVRVQAWQQALGKIDFKRYRDTLLCHVRCIVGSRSC